MRERRMMAEEGMNARGTDDDGDRRTQHTNQTRRSPGEGGAKARLIARQKKGGKEREIHRRTMLQEEGKKRSTLCNIWVNRTTNNSSKRWGTDGQRTDGREVSDHVGLDWIGLGVI
ncbi:hypothetical protein niasHT_003112 [Heterodera trifolii]|uniref:Uncharacterized protein n=1 Tax=Heterodera trifolii TaxID=157864 RepID=A0ABD2M569_9BILA